MSRVRHIVVAALLLMALSCNGPRRIPALTLVDIYHDMFLQDQKLRADHSLRHLTDTTLVYEGIFNAYGYDTEDYLYSVEYYIQDPEKFSKIFATVSNRLTRESEDLKKQVAYEDWKKQFMKIYGLIPDTTRGPKVPKDIIDSLHFRLHGASIEYYPPEGFFPPDTLRP